MSHSAPQPPKSEAYTTASNPTTRNPVENAAAQGSEASARDATLGRTAFPSSQSQKADDAVPSSLGWGVHSSGPVSETEKRNTVYSDRAAREGPENANVEAEQLETFAEGKVADAVDRKSGGQKVPGQELHFDDYADGLER
ncbi:uncharacterized protein CTRU02_201181 [Colletotrichum truncatum]|uniref:Uncharacterized protein n=1 Tax=Colletotrichum truncatum TaxID=5467 RepID=A0ACC3ZGR3_COLTU